MNRVTATHEAGHAVGRLLTADLMGYSPEEAVDRIQIGGDYVQPGLRSLGQTIGPMVCRSHQDAIKQYIVSTTQQFDAWQAIKAAGTSQDKRTSMTTKMLICTMGAAAEARQQRFNGPSMVYGTDACAGDRQDFANCCRVLGLDASDSEAAEIQYLEHSRQLVRRDAVWKAIGAIAFALVEAKEDMDGLRVYELARPHLTGFNGSDVLPAGW